MNRKPWQIDAAGSATILALAILCCALRFFPMRQAHLAASAAVTDLEAQRATSRTLEGKLGQLEKQLAGSNDDLATLPASFKLQPASALNERLAQLTDLASLAGVTIDSLNCETAKPGLNYVTVPIHFAGTGHYRNCVALLQAVGEQMPDIAVSGLHISAGSDPTKVTLRFDLDWHTQGPDAARKR